MAANGKEEPFLFKVAQPLGPPPIMPPPVEGKLQCAMQFIIPELRVGNGQKEAICKLAQKCGFGFWGIHTRLVRNQRTQREATLFTLAFYVTNTGEGDKQNTVAFTGRLLAERLLGILSFYAGVKLSILNPQATFMKNEQCFLNLPSVGRGDMPKFPIEFNAALFERTDVPDYVFSALFWLRRGLAEEDPIETFSSLMVCLQVIARHLVPEEKQIQLCSQCGAKIGDKTTGITEQVHKLIIERLQEPDELYKKIWKARNAIVAHGNIPVTPEVLFSLTELKFEAARLAYNSIKLALGLKVNSSPVPNKAFFITDALMYCD